MWKRIFKTALSVVAFLLFPLAIYLLHRQLRDLDYGQIVHQFREIPAGKVIFALVLTILNYLVLTVYDVIGLRFIRRPLAYTKACLASFVGFAFSNSMGFFVFSSSLVRFGLYSNWGLTAGEVASVIAFNNITFSLGLYTVGGAMLLWDPPFAVPLGWSLLSMSLRALGALLLALASVYLFFCFYRKRPIRIRSLEIPVPSPGLALTQLAVSMGDWLLAAGVLYVLLPAGVPMSFPAFFGIFILAQLLGLLSQIPGGLGVFETTIVLLLRQACPGDLLVGNALVGTLLTYRLVYYLFPLVMAAGLLGGYEVTRRRHRFQKMAFYLADWLPLIAPPIFTFLVFLSGGLLVISGATPAVDARLAWLDGVLPLFVIELSHFVSGLIGVSLLLLARGLQLRLRAAYWASTVLLALALVLSLLKGFEYEQATVLGLLLLALLPCRSYFHRKTSLIEERFSPKWVMAVLLVLAGSIWIGTFTFKHVEYRDDLWWQFALHGDAPRFLRASVGATVLAVILALLRLLRTARHRPPPPAAAELERVEKIIALSPRTYANLALLGDKALLFSATGNAFLMYAVSGRSWIAMGDPVGAGEEFSELVWSYRELCDRHRGWCVFYEVSKEQLPLYLDLGLAPLKIGEEARVSLAGFALEGKEWKNMRHLSKKMERDGVTFELVPREQVAERLPEFRLISAAWLGTRNAREKGFSLGCFNESYLRHFPAAVVCQHGKAVAFANLWIGGGGEEFSVDLMRQLPEAPAGTMDFLFLELMIWGGAQGYRWFNLGMAPLAGLESRPLAPTWQRVGALVYRHGEQFYNFEGLREYKQKFNPVWEPKYLVYPGHLNLPQVLVSITSLISGGLKGVVAK